MFLTNDGKIYGCGHSTYGQLGLKTTKNVPIPTLIHNMSNKFVIKLACGWNHTIALVSPSYVYVTGLGQYGQLGLRDLELRRQFNFVDALSTKNISSIFAGGHHSWFLVDVEHPGLSDYEIPSPLLDTPEVSITSKSNKKPRNFLTKRSSSKKDDQLSTGGNEKANKSFIKRKQKTDYSVKDFRPIGRLNRDDDAKSDNVILVKERKSYDPYRLTGFMQRKSTTNEGYVNEPREQDLRKNLGVLDSNYDNRGFKTPNEDEEDEQENRRLDMLNSMQFSYANRKRPTEQSQNPHRNFPEDVEEESPDDMKRPSINSGEDAEESDEYPDTSPFIKGSDKGFRNKDRKKDSFRQYIHPEDDKQKDLSEEADEDDDFEDITSKIKSRAQEPHDFNSMLQSKGQQRDYPKEPQTDPKFNKMYGNPDHNPVTGFNVPEYTDTDPNTPQGNFFEVVDKLKNNNQPKPLSRRQYDPIEEEDNNRNIEADLLNSEAVQPNPVHLQRMDDFKEDIYYKRLSAYRFNLVFTDLEASHKFILIQCESSKVPEVKRIAFNVVEELKTNDPDVISSEVVKHDPYYKKRSNGLFKIDNTTTGTDTVTAMIVHKPRNFEQIKTDRMLKRSNYNSLEFSDTFLGPMYHMSTSDFQKDKRWQILGYWAMCFIEKLENTAIDMKFYELRPGGLK